MALKAPLAGPTYRGVQIIFDALPNDAGQRYSVSYKIGAGAAVVLADKVTLPKIAGIKTGEWVGFANRATADQDQISVTIVEYDDKGATVLDQGTFGPFAPSDLLGLLDQTFLAAMTQAADGLGWTAQQKQGAAAMLRRAAVIVWNGKVQADSAALAAAKGAKDAEAISVG